VPDKKQASTYYRSAPQIKDQVTNDQNRYATCGN
jgi:hypothetical protein